MTALIPVAHRHRGIQLETQLTLEVSLLAPILALTEVLTQTLRASLGVDVRTVPIRTRHITIVANDTEYPACRATLQELFTAGTKLLDAVVFLASDSKQRSKFALQGPSDELPAAEVDVQKCLAAAIFLLFRSDKIYIRPMEVTPSIFTMHGLPTLDLALFQQTLSSISPEEFPLQLFSQLSPDCLGEKLSNSLQLGYAGLRQLQFVARYTPDSVSRVEVAPHVASVRAFYDLVKGAGFGNSKRPPGFIAEFGSLNQYLDLILLAGYSPSTLLSGVESRALYTVPVARTFQLPMVSLTGDRLQRVGLLVGDNDGEAIQAGCISVSAYNKSVDLHLQELEKSGAETDVRRAVELHKANAGYVPKTRQNVYRKVSERMEPGRNLLAAMMAPPDPIPQPAAPDSEEATA